MWRNQQGMIGIFLEVIIVIVLVFGFLVAVKMQSKPRVTASDVYPRTLSASTPRAETASSPNTLGSAVVPEVKEKILQDEIVYTDTGFEPDVLQIKNTHRVILFRNKSTQKMYVVSAGYPNLPTLPSLNQGYSVDPGGVYWFAFSAGKGTYNYFNLVNPGHQGVIIAR